MGSHYRIILVLNCPFRVGAFPRHSKWPPRRDMPWPIGTAGYPPLVGGMAITRHLIYHCCITWLHRSRELQEDLM